MGNEKMTSTSSSWIARWIVAVLLVLCVIGYVSTLQ
jgi:hypothetical protein